jgi:TolA-binding protein
VPEWTAASFFELGQVYLQLGDRTEAAKQFQTLIDKFPQGGKWTDAAKKKLEELKQP